MIPDSELEIGSKQNIAFRGCYKIQISSLLGMILPAFSA